MKITNSKIEERVQLHRVSVYVCMIVSFAYFYELLIATPRVHSFSERLAQGPFTLNKNECEISLLIAAATWWN